MYKITELQIYEAKADNKRETDKCNGCIMSVITEDL